MSTVTVSRRRIVPGPSHRSHGFYFGFFLQNIYIFFFFLLANKNGCDCVIFRIPGAFTQSQTCFGLVKIALYKPVDNTSLNHHQKMNQAKLAKGFIQAFNAGTNFDIKTPLLEVSSLEERTNESGATRTMYVL
jgi:hypothetical protein